jgi:hypothetical protein
MKNFLRVIALLIFASNAFADSQFVNRQSIMEHPYSCDNGGTVQLFSTRYGNVKKVVFSKSGSLNQVGYVNFWSMTDHYQGEVVTSMKFPDVTSGESPTEGRRFADMVIEYNGNGLVLTVTPIRSNQGPGFSCRNY